VNLKNAIQTGLQNSGNLKDNETKRDENRGVIPLFAEPNERVCQAMVLGAR